jgi:hypothetical protein
VFLKDLDKALFARVAACADSGAWSAWGAWVSWNFSNDSSYESAHLRSVEQAISLEPSSVEGADLVHSIARQLARLRRLNGAELKKIPKRGSTFSRREMRRYDFASGSEWAQVGVKGEVGATLPPGTEFEVVPRRLAPGIPNAVWVTFGPAVTSTHTADQVCATLGLPWAQTSGPIVHLELTLPDQAINMAMPTIFDSVPVRTPEWRARPESERKPGEPWGMTRHLETGRPGAPEIIVELDGSRSIRARCVGNLKSDWQTPPYLRLGPQ